MIEIIPTLIGKKISVTIFIDDMEVLEVDHYQAYEIADKINGEVTRLLIKAKKD